MHLQYIEEMLDLPEVQVIEVDSSDREIIFVKVEPKDRIQPCSICGSLRVTRQGRNKTRQVRHLSAFGKLVFLCVPAIRLYCKNCSCYFVWQYSFVGPKKRYSQAFEEHCSQQAARSNVKHVAESNQLPQSTLQSTYTKWLTTTSNHLQQAVWQLTQQRDGLVLGIDDFAIRKGHTYNTGIHDLRGETLLDVLPGRTLEDLRSYTQSHPAFATLQPKAVVMDLAPYYHAWIQEVFPKAIRIADRFHVVRYVIEALHTIRKEVQKHLAPYAKEQLKKNHRLLNVRYEQLSESRKPLLHQILNYSPLLKSVYDWKEALTEWYDLSLNISLAKRSFEKWCEQGSLLQHPAVDRCLKTVLNWQEEIINYHHCRFTNAVPEGRNNKIKAFQRRHFFTRNRDNYLGGIFIECNRSVFTF